MIRINLLPTEEIAKVKGVKSQLFLGILIIGLAVLFFGLQYSALNDEVAILQADIAQAEKEKARLKNIEKENDEIRKKNEELKKRLDTITQLDWGRTLPIRLYDEMASILNTSKSKIYIWLNILNYTGTSVHLQGYAFTNPDISKFMKALEASPYYKGVELEQTQKVPAPQEGVETPLYEFSIRAEVEQPPREAKGEEKGV